MPTSSDEILTHEFEHCGRRGKDKQNVVNNISELFSLLPLLRATKPTRQLEYSVAVAHAIGEGRGSGGAGHRRALHAEEGSTSQAETLSHDNSGRFAPLIICLMEGGLLRPITRST
eukprot:6183574-Pleurochrysis_carterae.AAC.3